MKNLITILILGSLLACSKKEDPKPITKPNNSTHTKEDSILKCKLYVGSGDLKVGYTYTTRYKTNLTNGYIKAVSDGVSTTGPGDNNDKDVYLYKGDTFNIITQSRGDAYADVSFSEYDLDNNYVGGIQTQVVGTSTPDGKPLIIYDTLTYIIK